MQVKIENIQQTTSNNGWNALLPVLLTLLKKVSFTDLVHKHQTRPDYRENETHNFPIRWPK